MMTSIPLRIARSNHLMLRGRTGSHELRFIIDTGATASCLDRSRCAHLGKLKSSLMDMKTLGELKEQQTQQLQLIDFHLGAVHLPNSYFSLIDLSQINEVLNRLGDPLIDGLIGMDILIAHQGEINIANLSLKLKEK